jgi:hypothetical protein
MMTGVMDVGLKGAEAGMEKNQKTKPSKVITGKPQICAHPNRPR